MSTSAANGSVSASEAQAMAQYIHSFMDLVDNLPNDITRHLTQLHDIHSNHLNVIDAINTTVDRHEKVVAMTSMSASVVAIDGDCNGVSNEAMDQLMNKRRRLAKRLETQLVQMQELSDEKLRYSQLIIDLIESKAKELDLDYEEVVRFSSNGRQLGSHSINGNHNNTTNGYNKLSANNGSTHSSTVANGVDTKDKSSTAAEDKSLNDKRLLPRRACAVKVDTKDTAADDESPYLSPKVVPNKIIKSSSLTSKAAYNKSHGFGHSSMSNFIRDLARKQVHRRRAIKQLPNASKIATKLSDNRLKKSTQSVRQSAAKKSTRKSLNSSKRLFVSNSGSVANRQLNATNGGEVQRRHKRVHKQKSSAMCSSRSSSSSSTSSMSYDNDVYEPPKSSVANNASGSATNGTNQSTVKRESSAVTSKRTNSCDNSYNNNNSNNSNHHKKSRVNTSGHKSGAGGGYPSSGGSGADDLFIGEPIDPNEPTYCLCDQVSYGEMICCDNRNCAIEWFHFPCVQLSHKPKGKWYCPKCRRQRDRYSVPKRHTSAAKD